MNRDMCLKANKSVIKPSWGSKSYFNESVIIRSLGVFVIRSLEKSRSVSLRDLIRGTKDMGGNNDREVGGLLGFTSQLQGIRIS